MRIFCHTQWQKACVWTLLLFAIVLGSTTEWRMSRALDTIVVDREVGVTPDSKTNKPVAGLTGRGPGKDGTAVMTAAIYGDFESCRRPGPSRNWRHSLLGPRGLIGCPGPFHNGAAGTLVNMYICISREMRPLMLQQGVRQDKPSLERSLRRTARWPLPNNCNHYWFTLPQFYISSYASTIII